jgi:hypothetical protein
MQDANLPSVGDETMSGSMVEIPDRMGWGCSLLRCLAVRHA